MAAGDLSSMRSSSTAALVDVVAHQVHFRPIEAPLGRDRLAGQAHLAEARRRDQLAQHGQHLAGEHAHLDLGQAEDGVRAATTMSHMPMMPMPPAMQAPLTRAISGTVELARRRNRLAKPIEAPE